MSLIKCPECGKEISDKAEMCPNCGHPIKGKEKVAKLKSHVNKKTIAITCVALIICVCAIIIYFRSINTYNLEDYAAIMSVQAVSKNQDGVIINECRSHYYNPQLESDIYNISESDIPESIVVFLDVNQRSELGGMDKEYYIYTYDMEGNCTFYSSYSDYSIGGNSNSEIWSYVDKSSSIDWYKWENYSASDINKYKDKNISNAILKTPDNNFTEEEKDTIITMCAEYEINIQEYDSAFSYVLKISNKETQEKLFEKINDGHYNLGLSAMDKKEYTNAIDYFGQCNQYKDSKMKISECNYLLGKANYESEDYDTALEYLSKAQDYEKTKKLVDEINSIQAANKLEMDYEEATHNASEGELTKAKNFFEKNPDYKDSKEYLKLIKKAEKSTFLGYWYCDDSRLTKYGGLSHIVKCKLRILASVNWKKEIIYRIQDAYHWDEESLKYPGFDWVLTTENQLDGGMFDDRIVINGDELTYKRAGERRQNKDGSYTFIDSTDFIFTRSKTMKKLEQ